MSCNPPAILEQLAQGTRDLHARVEGRVPLLDPELQLDTYRAFLDAMLGFYEPFEDALAAFPWHGLRLDFDQRRKARLIVHDLRQLGRDDRYIASLRRCRDLPRPTDLLEALGCLYVLEGATLGGKILTRSVARTLGLSPATGCAFLASYGHAVGPMWRAFGAVLTRAAHAPATRDGSAHPRIVAAARDTFSRLERWLAGPLPSPLGAG